ncbi:MAG TPA: YciI family protein [Terriglobia bacterium]|nr:YciI family protein [Terriglobia bacterium]
MQYLLLIYDNEKRWSKGYDKGELEQYRAFSKEYAATIKGGNALQPTSTAVTVRVRDGKALTTDGPFAETKEQLAGFYLIEATNREEAAAIAAKIPGARFGSVEVRPIMTFS